MVRDYTKIVKIRVSMDRTECGTGLKIQVVSCRR